MHGDPERGYVSTEDGQPLEVLTPPPPPALKRPERRHWREEVRRTLGTRWRALSPSQRLAWLKRAERDGLIYRDRPALRYYELKTQAKREGPKRHTENGREKFDCISRVVDMHKRRGPSVTGPSITGRLSIWRRPEGDCATHLSADDWDSIERYNAVEWADDDLGAMPQTPPRHLAGEGPERLRSNAWLRTVPVGANLEPDEVLALIDGACEGRNPATLMTWLINDPSIRRDFTRALQDKNEADMARRRAPHRPH